MPSAIVLLSGGLDSTTVATLVVKTFGKENVCAFSAGYGQKHAAEISHAWAVAERLGIRHFVVQVPKAIFIAPDSSQVSTVLLNGPSQPHLTYSEIAKEEGPSPTVVPFRNGVLLAIATAFSVANGYDWVYAGMHAEDARNWAYPDCTPEFTGAMANAIRVGSYDKVRLAVPLQWMLKKDVVKLGLELGAPYELTLSCYDGLEPACGLCPTCIERLAAFEANGVPDPIPYREDYNDA